MSYTIEPVNPGQYEHPDISKGSECYAALLSMGYTPTGKVESSSHGVFVECLDSQDKYCMVKVSQS